MKIFFSVVAALLSLVPDQVSAAAARIERLPSASPYDSVAFIKIDPTHAYTPIDRVADPVPFPPIIPLQQIDPTLAPGKIIGILPIGGWNNPWNPNNYVKDAGGVFVDGAGNFLSPGSRTTAPPCTSEPGIAEDFFTTGPVSPVAVEIPEGAVGVMFSAGASVYHDNIDPDNDYGVQITVSTISVATADKKPVFSGKATRFHLTAINSLPNMSHTFSLYQPPSHGNAGVSPDGTVDYYSTPGFFGFDKMKVKVTDSGGVFTVVDVSVEVNEDLCANLPAGIPCDSESRWQSPMTKAGTPNNTCSKTQSFTSKPVNVCTGNLWHQERDFFLPGRSQDTGILFSRTYLARPADASGDFGPGWYMGFSSKLKLVSEDPEASAIWIDEQGGPWQFMNQGDGTFRAPQGFHGHLVHQEDRFELVTQDKTKYVFSLNGRLLEKRSRWGDSIFLFYDEQGRVSRISNGISGDISIVRDGSGRVVSVSRLRDGLTWQYFYDSNGRLREARDFSGAAHTYTYSPVGLLSSITDGLGRVEHYTYYPNGRAWQQFEPEGGMRIFSYSPDGEDGASTSLLDIDGSLTTWHFDDLNRTIRTVKADGGEARQFWNSLGEIERTVDEFGNETHYQYDEGGNLSGIKRPGESAFTTITWDQTWNVPVKKVPLAGAPDQPEVLLPLTMRPNPAQVA